MIDTDTPLARLAHNMLNHACPNGGVEEDGWATYCIETHCVAWRVTARKEQGRWHIRNITREYC
jgi:hypothetical protein